MPFRIVLEICASNHLIYEPFWMILAWKTYRFQLHWFEITVLNFYKNPTDLRLPTEKLLTEHLTEKLELKTLKLANWTGIKYKEN